MRRLLVLVVIAAMALAPGCGSEQDAPLSSFTDPAQLIVAESSDRILIDIEGNATTGFEWVVDESHDTSVVTLVGETYLVADGDDQLVGQGGVFRFEFEAQGEGSTSIGFIYTRAFSGDVAQMTNFDIVVE